MKNQQQQFQQQQDSIYYYKPSQFKDFIQRIANKSDLLVSEAFQTFREVKCLPNRFKQMLVEELSQNPELIEGVYVGLRNGMQPYSKFQLPYNCSKLERQCEILDQIMDYCEDKDNAINQDKAVCKIVTGKYSDGVRVFGYAIEVAAAPYEDYTLEDGGHVDLIGCINSTPSIDGGESYFQGGHYEWTDNTKDEMHQV